MSAKLKIFIPIFFLAGIILTLIYLTTNLIHAQKDDGLIINLAGRQRMLTQKITKEVLVLQLNRSHESGHNERQVANIKNTVAVFDMTLKALTNSGKAPLGLNLKSTKFRMCPQATGEAEAQLVKVSKLWKHFKENVSIVLDNGEDLEQAVKYVEDNNVTLLKEMNKAVGILQKQSERKVSILKMEQMVGLGATVISVLVAFFLISKTLRLLAVDINGLDGNTTSIKKISSEVSYSVDQLSSSTAQQSATLEEISSLLDNVMSMTSNNTDNSSQALKLALTSDTTAKNGKMEVGELLVSIKEIANSSNKISEIINVIEEIAFQTNILAINASIEAAKAGELGKGFAVVAIEVRDLASRSSDAAKEITELIQDTVLKVNRGAEKAQESEVVLEKIVSSVGDVVTLNEEISSGSKEQKEALHMVEDAVGQVNLAIQANAEAAGANAASAQDMLGQAEELYKTTSSLSRLVHGNS